MSRPATGAQTTLYYVKETTIGEVPANPVWIPLRYAGGIPQLTRESLESAELDGGRESFNFRLGAHLASGDVNVELSHLTHNDLIAAALQGQFVEDPKDSTRLICKVGGTVQSFSFLVKYEDLMPGTPKYDLITGVEITGFSFGFTPNAMTTGSFNTIGRMYKADATLPAGSTFEDATVTRPYTGLDATVLLDDVAVGCITAFNPKNENGASAEYGLGSGGVCYISYGKSVNTFDLTTVFTDYKLFKKFIDETLCDIKIKLTLDNNYLELHYPRCQLMSASPNPQSAGTIVLPVTVKALKDKTLGSSVVISCNKP